MPDVPIPATLPPVHPLRWYALVAIVTAQIMDLLDANVVGVAAPSIQADLGGGSTVIQWVAAGYTLAFAVGLITGGRLGDRYGRRRMFLIGLTGFVVTSALCGLAVTPEMLVASRVLQGLFGAALIPQGLGMIKAMFPPQELRAAFGTFGPAIGLSLVGAPILAGALIAGDLGGFGWRTIFLINVPIGLACLALAARTMPESRSEHGPRLDPVGMLLVSVGLGLLVFPLVQGRELGWPAWTHLMIAASVPVLAGFAMHQVRRSRAGRSPLVEPALFSSRAFPAGLAFGLTFFAGMTALAFLIGLYVQLALGFTPLQAGLTQVPWALGTAIGAGLSAAVLGRHGRPVLQAGTVIMTVGVGVVLLTLELTEGSVTGWQVAPGLLVCGFGMGLAITTYFDIVLAGVRLEMVGSAAGVLSANQQLGAATGFAALGTVFFGLLEGGDPLGAITTALWAVGGLILLAGALASFLPRHARPEDAPAASDPVSVRP